MFKTTLTIDGMMCGMCEAHVNDAVRATVKVKSVKSSHKNGITEIISKQAIDTELVAAAIEKTGYHVLQTKTEPYEKKGWFHH